MTLPIKATSDLRSSDFRDPAEATRICRVCGDAATGMYFGALVCVPCKTFFLRYAGDGFSYECKYSKSCEVTTATRTQCKYCRYQKCLRVGMCRRVRPAQIEAQDGQQLCVVCQDVANGVHFGVLTCEGCKKFFRRGLTEQKSYRCRNNQNCSINPSNRNACRFCRFKKCIKAGMSRDAIQMGRPSKMSVLENSHGLRMPQSHDTTDHRPILVAPSQSFSFLPGIETSTRSEDRRTSTTAALPAWMEDPLMVNPGEAGRNPWTPYDALRQGWHGVGAVPLVGKFSPAKVASDDPEGDRSDGSACPDSTMVREEADPFLPNDFTRSLTSCEEEYLHDWPEMPTGSNFRREAVTSVRIREASSVAMATTCKLEVLTSDDDGEESTPAYKRNRFDEEDEGAPGGFKRVRYDGGTGDDCLLPPGAFDLPPALKYSPAAGKLDEMPPISGLGSSEDVTSSGIVMRAFADALLLPAEVRNPVSGLDDRVPGCGSTTSGFLDHPVGMEVRIGSPSVSSSSCPLDAMKMEKTEVLAGQGQTTGQSTSGGFGSGCTCQMTSEKGCLSSERSEVSMEWREMGRSGCLDLEQKHGSSSVEEVGNQCWQTIKTVIPAYHRFVNSSTLINGQLKEAYQSWKRENPNSDCADELSLWIQTIVVPAYTTASVTYCKSLPDFTSLSPVDQRTLIAGGQSESRILVAALHWYDAVERRFRNFLTWREDSPQRPDVFKIKLRDFADRITKLHLDPIEAALLNAVGVFSTDYPNLKDCRSIEASRAKILTTMKSYIASNNSAPGERVETLFRVLREAQSLGAEHVALTNTRTLGLPAASEAQKRSGPVVPPGQSTGTDGQCGQARATGQSTTIDSTADQLTTVKSTGQPLSDQSAYGRSTTGQYTSDQSDQCARSSQSASDQPTSGQSTSGQSTSGQSTTDQCVSGQSASGQSTTGQSTSTCSLTRNTSAPTGQSLTTVHPAKGQPLDGQLSSDTEKSPSGELTNRNMPSGDLPQGHTPCGKFPEEELGSAGLPDGELSAENLAAETLPGDSPQVQRNQ